MKQFLSQGIFAAVFILLACLFYRAPASLVEAVLWGGCLSLAFDVGGGIKNMLKA